MTKKNIKPQAKKTVANKKTTKMTMMKSMSKPLSHYVVLVKSLMAKKALLNSQKNSWFSSSVDLKGIDTKLFDMKGQSFSDQLKEVDTQVSEVRSIVRAGFGLRPLDVNLYQTTYISNTGSGTQQAVFQLSVFNTTEFGAFQTLFDEVSVHSVSATYQSLTAAAWAIGNPPIGQTNGWCFDPESGVVISSLANLMDNNVHRLYQIPLLFNTTGLLYYPCITNIPIHKIHFKIPPGPLIVTGSAGGQNGSAWMPTSPTSATNYQTGFIKWYEFNQQSSSQSVGYCTVTYHTKFRSRD